MHKYGWPALTDAIPSLYFHDVNLEKRPLKEIHRHNHVTIFHASHDVCGVWIRFMVVDEISSTDIETSE